MSNYGDGGGGGGDNIGGRGGGGVFFMYMATIQDAIKRGNKDELRTLLEQARGLAKEQSSLAQAIRDLENALK